MRLPISRLTLRIYIVSLIQAALGVAAIIVYVLVAIRAHPEMDEKQIPNYVIAEVARAHDDPSVFEEKTRDFARMLYVSIRVADRRGVRVFAAPGELQSCWTASPRDTVERQLADRLCIARQVTTAGGEPITIDVVRRRTGITLPQIALMHAVIFAVGSLLLGSSLVRPLRHMSAVARAFGHGDTAARVNLTRRDDLGDVARAFDEMADHVVNVRRAERELLANISHELRTPLTRIRLALEFANHEKPEVAFQSQKDIADDLDELETLVTDILTAARLELDDSDAKGISPLRKERLEARELVTRAESRFRAAHPTRELRVVGDLGDAAFDVDPVQLRRALDNLLDNAHKYTREPDAAIELRAEATEDTIVIRVIDRGVGISEEDQARLFRPFFRADRSRSRATGGLGLGLLLVRRIAEAHGGRVTIKSEPSAGTEARIEVPRLR